MLILQLITLVLTGIYIIYKDLKERIIPNKIILVLFGISIIISIIDKNILYHILGFIVVGTIVLFIAIITKAFGMGDVKYMYAIGGLLGLKLGLYALILSFLIGGLSSLVLLLIKKIKLNDTIAFGPFLVIGSIMALFI